MADSIIILDSSQENAVNLTQVLTQNGFRTEIETNPDALVATLQSIKSLLIINDPENAFLEESECLQKIKDANPNQPVIVVSNQQDPNSLVKIANTGVELLLESALDEESLLRICGKYVNSTSGSDRCELNLPSSLSKTIDTPAPDAKHLGPYSANADTRLQTLWKLFQAGNHIFINAPQGTELDLVIAELSEWSKHPDRRTLWIEAEELATPETKQTLDQITAQETFSTVIGINDFSEIQKKSHDAITRFVKHGYQKITQGTSLTFVYHLESEDISQFPPELSAFIKSHLIAIPPLRERLIDMAFYTHRYLEMMADQEGWPTRAHWAPEAMNVLCRHKWTNNYTELMSFLRKICRLGDKSLITVETVLELLNVQDTISAQEAPHALHDFLILKQNEYMQEIGTASGLSTEEILSKLGNIEAKPGPSGEIEVLMFPELVPSGTATHA